MAEAIIDTFEDGNKVFDSKDEIILHLRRLEQNSYKTAEW